MTLPPNSTGKTPYNKKIEDELIQMFRNNNPQIEDYEIDIDLDKYHRQEDKSYVYEWTNLKNLEIYENTKKKCKIYYIGYNEKDQKLPHQAIGLPYFHSSENKVFLEDVSDSDGRWKLKIRSIPTNTVGISDEMQLEEFYILSAADGGMGAAKSKLYYNQSNGGIMKKNEKFDIVKCDKFVQLVEAGNWPTRIEDKELYREMEDFQPRDETDLDWMEDIRFKVDAKNGNIEKTDPYIVAEGRGKRGKGKGLGGIHTKGGVMRSNSPMIKIISIPYEILKDFTSSEIRYCCNSLNRRDEVESKKINVATAVKQLVDDYIEDKKEVDDPVNLLILKRFGFSRAIPKIIETATYEIKLIKENEANGIAGKVRRRYDTPTKKGGHKDIMTKKVNAINNPIDPKTDKLIKTGTIGIAFSSGNIKGVPISIVDEVIERKSDGGWPELEKIILIPHHTCELYHHDYDNKSKSGAEARRQVLMRRLEEFWPNVKIEEETVEEFDYHTSK